MAKLIFEKQCERCEITLFNVDISKKYCDFCRLIVDKENGQRYRDKNPRNVRDESMYLNNFLKVVKTEHHLTTKGFNEVSSLKSASYLNYYKKPWIEILKDYGYEDKLYNYLSKEFSRFNIETSSKDIKKFFNEHKYLSTRMLNTLDVDRIRELSEVKGMNKNYTIDNLRDNLYYLKAKLNGIPLYNEFENFTRISFPVYYRITGLTKYDSILEYFFNIDELNEYYKRRSLHKTAIGKVTGKLAKKYSNEYLKDELVRVFELCIKKYGSYPSRRLFSKLSKFDCRTYTQRFNMSWIKVCEMFGYNVDYINKAEKMCLELISNITDCNYEPQKTFDWLIGINNYPLFCDGYFSELNLIIEFDGIQHRKPIKKFGGEERFRITVANDNVKNTEIPKHGLTLIRIRSDEPWYDEEYIKSKLNTYNIPTSA